MTIQQLLSPTVRDWVKKINENNPNLSNKKFRELFEEWFDKNEDSIILNESVDMSKYCRLNESDDFDDFDDFDDEDTEVEFEEPETESETESEPTKKSGDFDGDDFDGDDFDDSSIEDEDYSTFKDVEGGDEEIREKPVTIKPLSDAETEKISSKIKGKYLVNNGKDFEHNIFNVVNAWYDDCIQSGTGENLEENNRICLLDTSVVENMSALFAFANVPNLNLSGWDTSAVKNMEGMFYKSTFDNKSIEGWDVSMCINFKNMFESCRFSGDISGWTPGKVLKDVFDEFGEPKMRVKKDHAGKELRDAETGKPIWEVVKARVDAELPEVGNRKHGINDAKKRRVLKELQKLDSAAKEMEEDEREKRLLKHVDENYSMSNICDYDNFIKR